MISLKILPEEDTQYGKEFGLFFQYHPQLVEKCRKIKDSFGWQQFSFDGNLKAWSFTSDVLEVVLKNFEIDDVDPRIADEFDIEIPETKHDIAQEEIVKEISDIEPPDTSMIKGKLYSFQEDAVRFLERNDGSGILAMDMGTGKTLCSITFTTAHKYKTLVVCPKSVKYVWENEIAKWTDRSFFIIEPKTELPRKEDYAYIVINYDLLLKDEIYKWLEKRGFDAIIADECHYIKRPEGVPKPAQRATRVIDLDIPNKILMSGTIMPNRPWEIFAPLHYLNKKAFNNFYAFANKFCGAYRDRFGYRYDGATNKQELAGILNKYMFRVRKEDVLKELPPKIKEDIIFPLPASVLSRYNKAVDNFYAFLVERYEEELENGELTEKDIMRKIRSEALVKLGELKTFVSEAKISYTTDFVKDIVEDNDSSKFIVFCSYRKSAEALKEKFSKFNSVLIYGGTKQEDRKKYIAKFQNDPKCRVFVSTFGAGSVGLTLTSANTVIFHDLPWSPADISQATDRAHRIGSEHSSILIYKLIARSTIEEDINNLLKSKEHTIDQIVDNTEVASSVQGGLLKKMFDQSRK